jgi:hypothetical protein
VTGAQAGRANLDAQQVDALVTDRYIDSILAAHGRGADAGPIAADRRPEEAIRLVAARLARELPRLHPSFRFEEALATKLADAAIRMRRPLVDGTATGLPLDPFGPIEIGANRAATAAPAVRQWGDARIEVGRPLLIGGAITSAALSLAGAAYVAWRFRHPQAGPMARAVRRVARTRLA